MFIVIAYIPRDLVKGPVVAVGLVTLLENIMFGDEVAYGKQEYMRKGEWSTVFMKETINDEYTRKHSLMAMELSEKVHLEHSKMAWNSRLLTSNRMQSHS